VKITLFLMVVSSMEREHIFSLLILGEMAKELSNVGSFQHSDERW